MVKPKVVLGLSGGVDSAVSALLLKQQGYEVDTVYLLCWSQPGCRADQDRADALKVALRLDLPFKVLDFRKEYKGEVMDYFYQEYKDARTPNPDILCNSVIKFGLFYDWAMKTGYDYVATGHYAKIKKIKGNHVILSENEGSKHQSNSDIAKDSSSATSGLTENNTYFLTTPKDFKKDQTHFLYRLKCEQLPHILFPLGNYLKSEVRTIARENNIVVADKDDSMGICFVGDVNVGEMLEKKFGKKTGEVQLVDGTIIGEHDGYWFFTRGFRGGWRRKAKIKTHFNNDELPKLYVTDIKKEENVIIVGERQETLRSDFCIKDIHWICHNNLTEKFVDNIYVRIRNTGDFIPAEVVKESTVYTIKLEQPEFGVSPGQSCVIYQSPEKSRNYNIVLGGGVIC